MFQALHQTVEHTISLPLSTGDAFALFTPEGERHWIAEWSPRYFYPANGETLVGMVFMTGEGEETTWWSVVDYDLASHFVRYCRVTPGSRSVIVEVRCAAAGTHDTAVSVRYTLTGLSDAGNAAIAEFVAGYDEMIEGWRMKILRYLSRSNAQIHP
jgi:hypothetical protein